MTQTMIVHLKSETAKLHMQKNAAEIKVRIFSTINLTQLDKTNFWRV